MLTDETPFPNPGSVALHVPSGQRARIFRHNADGTPTLSIEGPRAHFQRDAVLSDLADLSSAIARRPDAALAIRLAWLVQDSSAITTAEAMDLAKTLWMERRIPAEPTVGQVRSILRALGWQCRNEGTRYRWHRISTTSRAIEVAA